jgi:inorganic pyrophosphatase
MIDVFIEVSKGSDRKSKYDENTFEFIKSVEMLRPYPYPYGFILGTKGDDEEAVDAFIITDKRLEPGIKVQCEPVGLLEMFEGDEHDHKVLAVLPGENVSFDNGVHEKLKDFIYTIFTRFPEIEVRVGEILPKEAALDHLEKNS